MAEGELDSSLIPGAGTGALVRTTLPTELESKLSKTLGATVNQLCRSVMPELFLTLVGNQSDLGRVPHDFIAPGLVLDDPTSRGQAPRMKTYSTGEDASYHYLATFGQLPSISLVTPPLSKVIGEYVVLDNISGIARNLPRPGVYVSDYGESRHYAGYGFEVGA